MSQKAKKNLKKLQTYLLPVTVSFTLLFLGLVTFIYSQQTSYLLPFKIQTANRSAAKLSPTPNPIPPTPTSTPTPTPYQSLRSGTGQTPQLFPTPDLPTTTPQPSPTPVPVVNNTPPGAGYQRQQVQIDAGVFTVDIIAADLNSTKVIVDTASDSDCSNNCPALPLATYATRNGAYAAINGSYFCPPEYPSCAGKTNSFDTLLMNKNKHYFNSDNNVYSVVPAAIFSIGSARFVSRSLEWGRDTSVDAVIANHPLLIAEGQIAYGGSSDPKFNSKGPRDFVAHKGSMVYIGIVRNATMEQSAKVLKSLGMDAALNLDEGGSTALWFGGRYLAGPGRNIPNAVLFVQR